MCTFLDGISFNKHSFYYSLFIMNISWNKKRGKNLSMAEKKNNNCMDSLKYNQVVARKFGNSYFAISSCLTDEEHQEKKEVPNRTSNHQTTIKTALFKTETGCFFLTRLSWNIYYMPSARVHTGFWILLFRSLEKKKRWAAKRQWECHQTFTSYCPLLY